MRTFFYIFIFLSLLFVFGLIGFINSINKYKQPALQQVDVAVVLTGGAGRIAKGIEILNKNKVQKLFISGVHKTVEIRALLNQVKQNKVKADDIVLGYMANTTFENGIEVADFITKNNYKTIYLVTNSFHMPRSIREIEYRLPNIKIIPYPVQNKNIKIQQWYLYSGTLFVLIVEYIKNLAVIGRISIF